MKYSKRKTAALLLMMFAGLAYGFSDIKTPLLLTQLFFIAISALFIFYGAFLLLTVFRVIRSKKVSIGDQKYSFPSFVFFLGVMYYFCFGIALPGAAVRIILSIL